MKTSKASFTKNYYLSTHNTPRKGKAKGPDHPVAGSPMHRACSIADCLPLAYPLQVLRGLALCLALGAAGTSMAQPLPVVDVYKSPECGCCKSWAEHLQKNGFSVNLHDVDDVPAARKKLGMPSRYGSCHTAKVGEYLVEGHVPAADIKKLLKKHPKAIGLAVPSMPPGSPGMEGERSIPYDTLLITQDGKAKVFAHH